MKCLLALFIVTGLITTLFPPSITIAGFSSDPDEDSGWVKADVITGGCDNEGNCASGTRPGPDNLYEYRPDRERYGRGYGPAPQHGGHRTAINRQMCRYYGVNIGWSAGSWHHAASWSSMVYRGERVWSGPRSPHWGFSHNDTCRPLVTPTPPPPPPPTYTPIPDIPPTPTPRDAVDPSIAVDVKVSIEGPAPGGGGASASGDGMYRAGDVVEAKVSYPSSWDQHPSWAGISHSGCNTRGSGDWRVRLYAPASSCTVHFTIRFYDVLPTWTPVPWATPTPVMSQCEVQAVEWPVWLPTTIDTTAPGVMLSSNPTLVFEFDNLSKEKDIHTRHDTRNWNESYVKVMHLDTGKEMARMVWQVRGSNYRLTELLGGAEPVPRGFHVETYKDKVLTTSWTLYDLPPGQYRLDIRSMNQNCVKSIDPPTHHFQVDGTPPPPPGPSQATLYAWVYSPDDDEFLNTRENPNPARWRWLYGGPMEFYPDLDMDFTLDPALAAQGYRVESEITGWTFLGSPTLGPTEEELDYEETVQTLWTTIDGLQDDPDVYEYLMPYVKPQPLDVAVHYEYQMVDASGTPVGEPVEDTLEGTFTIGIVTPVMR